jgi:hypothetical protein
MPVPRSLPALFCVLALAAGTAGCGGDDGPTTTSAGSATVPPAMAAQGDRGGVATSAAPAPADALEGYLSDGRQATAQEAAPVRAGFRAFAEAVVARDAREACAHVTGFEELLRAAGQEGSCRDLLPDIGNAAAGPSPRDVAAIADAGVVLSGDRATISAGGEAPVPMRRVGGAWKLDYAAFAAVPKDRQP